MFENIVEDETREYTRVVTDDRRVFARNVPSKSWSVKNRTGTKAAGDFLHLTLSGKITRKTPFFYGARTRTNWRGLWVVLSVVQFKCYQVSKVYVAVTEYVRSGVPVRVARLGAVGFCEDDEIYKVYFAVAVGVA